MLESMLQICPAKRPTAQELLEHPFFEDCPEGPIEIDLGSSQKALMTKPQAPAATNPNNDGPVETVDLTEKPSLVGKRKHSEAVDLDDEEAVVSNTESKKPRLIP